MNQAVSTAPGSTRFAIFAAPRCGSNWLCTLLDSHPDILCHHELFNVAGIHIAWSLRGSDFSLGDLRQRDSDPSSLLQRAWSRNCGFRTIGFKLNVEDPDEVVDAVFEDRSILKIVLERHSRVRQYISEIIAEKTGVWESYPDSIKPTEGVAPLQVNAGDLMALDERNRNYYAGLRARLSDSGQTACEIKYEELGDVVKRQEWLRFLGVDDQAHLVDNTRRMNPQPLSSLIGNYLQLCEELRGTPLYNELADPGPIDT